MTQKNNAWRSVIVNDDPLCDRYFKKSGHNSNHHLKYTIIEQIKNRIYISNK